MDGGGSAGVLRMFGAALRHFVAGGGPARPADPRESAPPLKAAALAFAYGLAVVDVPVVTGLSLLAKRSHIENLEFPVFLLGIALVAWYLGGGPAIVAVVLSSLSFTWFFVEPLNSFAVYPADLPFFGTFIAFALLITGFSVVRRRFERELLRSREQLRNEVAVRTHREKEVRRLNEELAKRSAELESSNKELEAFAYSISHDLRAPLRHMVGYTELLQKHASSALDEKSQRFMATILDSTKRMGNLIDDLLAFSRIARAETRTSTVSLDQLVKEVRQEMQPEIRGRDIDWKIGSLPELHGDRAMLRLALVNLISNAVKFTSKRQQAEIEIGCLERKNEAVTVFIKDNGVGFDMRYVNKLFGVFQRLHRADAFEGTGIGLATVQRIIHRHGGKVWAEALIDHGATFFFSMPGNTR